MSCTPFETMSAYVDGALPELEKAAVRSHVDSCPECRSQLAELLSLKDAVRGLAPAAEASEEFKARLTTGFRKRRRRRSAGLAFAGGLVLAAAAIVVAVPIIRERRVMAALIGDHVGITVTREEPFHVTSGDAATLERWFTGKIDFPLHIPQIPNAKLVGARLCDIVGKEIPLASYELGTRRVSVLMERTARRARDTTCEEQVHGFTVCRRAVSGVEYLLVSDYPAAEAGRILTAALGPSTAP